jgi:hypothetical protein
MSKTKDKTTEKTESKLSIADLTFDKQGGLLPVILPRMKVQVLFCCWLIPIWR